MISERKIQARIASQASRDGDGVLIQRIAGQQLNAWLDPYLMLDELRSDDAADYIGGFPSHPHRGFETITYMLEGKMRHRDHLGNEGLIESGGVQWMTAGRGVIHSEMPEQDQGLMHGFQIWLNLPAAEKMKPAAYRDIRCAQIPQIHDKSGALIKLIAGTIEIEAQCFQGPIQGLSTQALLADIALPAHSQLSLKLPSHLRVLLYAWNGQTDEIANRSMAAFGQGDMLSLNTTDIGANLLLLAGKPISEPIVQHGPFVMNSIDEIYQAIQDYQNGELTGAAS